jgi:hypothetical protein
MRQKLPENTRSGKIPGVSTTALEDEEVLGSWVIKAHVGCLSFVSPLRFATENEANLHSSKEGKVSHMAE